MVALKDSQMVAVPIAEAIKMRKKVDLNSDKVLTARDIGICFGDKDTRGLSLSKLEESRLKIRKTNNYTEAYRLLYDHFGPQGWWPGDSPFEIMVGAILTQNTNWANVQKAIDNLKLEGLLSYPIPFSFDGR